MSSVSVILDRSAQRVPEERGQRPPRQALFTVAARTWKEWIGGAAVILAGLGGVLYGALFIAYGKFYEPLGTSPAEVGLDKVSILLASFGQLLYFTIGISLYFFLPMRPRGRAIWLPLVVLATLIIQLASLGHVMASRAVLVVKGRGGCRDPSLLGVSIRRDRDLGVSDAAAYGHPQPPFALPGRSGWHRGLLRLH
jgi:hypothetical protein